MDRKTFKDHTFMDMAISISGLGTCCRLKVGCILLRKDGSTASSGFNGALPGMAHCTPETCNESSRCVRTRHAERNALDFCTGEVHTAYVTAEPCLKCLQDLVSRGVRRIVYLRPYTSMSEQERANHREVVAHFEVSMSHLSSHPNA